MPLQSDHLVWKSSVAPSSGTLSTARSGQSAEVMLQKPHSIRLGTFLAGLDELNLRIRLSLSSRTVPLLLRLFHQSDAAALDTSGVCMWGFRILGLSNFLVGVS